MTFDLVVRGGRVVDGIGTPAYTADVAVLDGQVRKIGRVDDRALDEVDADGCIVAPGFIDIHTHYDAQLHWDRTASPSSWHGVTTVVTGNCGFSLFPARADDVPWLLDMLSRVEGMSAAALRAGVSFEGGGFDEFATGLEGRLGVNAAVQVGHSALRRYVLGDDAHRRVATEAEVDEMATLLRAALRAGAAGFSSSQLEMHVDHDGNPVPSNLASPEELVALAAVLAEFDHGVIEFISATNLAGHSEADRELMRAMCRASGKAMNINPLQRLPFLGDGWRLGLDFATECMRAGLRIHPQSSLQQLSVFFALHDTFLFDEMPAWRDALARPPAEKRALLTDPATRERLRAALADPTGRAFVFTWDAVKVARADEHSEWVGRTVESLAKQLGVDALDCFIDCSLAEELQTTFVLAGSAGKRSREATEEILRHPMSLPGSSDAGAHLTSYCGVDYSTRLLTEYAPEVITLEEAVAGLTSRPAAALGLGAERGRITSGAGADLTIWDPARLRAGATRWIQDFPAGAGRFVVDAEGYVANVVNGEVVRRDGADTGARPGEILRPAAPTHRDVFEG